MRFLSLIAAAFVLAPVLAAPAPEPEGLVGIESARGAAPGRYIVNFKKGASRKNHIGRLGLKPKAEWNNINGFVADIGESELNALRASPDVESISEDGIVTTTALVTQTNAPWGLGRIDQAAALSPQNAAATNHLFTYDTSAGYGVDVYVLDTGVKIDHSQFGGRATWGASLVGETTDGNGHGTHCAGTIAGSTFGVAKLANIISVQVLSSTGNGWMSDIVSGLNYVYNKVAQSGRPSVVSMSLGGDANTAIDNAVASLTSAGVHVVVSAGNSNQDAAYQSPARAPSAITVGATTVADARASYSNYGAGVDIFAPGSSVISSWITSTTATRSLSGTSMACPHVAGIVAYLIAKDGNITPAAMATKLQTLAVPNVLTGIPSGTPNLLAQIA